MEECFAYPSYQAADLSVSPSVAFDACGVYRMDAAAEQHMQRLASRNIFVCEKYVPPVLRDSKSRASS